MKNNSKKILKILSLFMFLVLVFYFNLFFNLNINNVLNVKNNVFCENFNNLNFKINVLGKDYFLSNFSGENLTIIQNELTKSGFNSRKNVLKFAINNGFTKEESLIYAFPELKNFLNFIESQYCYDYKNANLKSILNTGNIVLCNSKNGRKINKMQLFNDLFDKIMCFNSNFSIDLQFLNTVSEFDDSYFLDKMHLKGTFKTNFKTSSISRKNNIKKALASLDGVVIMPNELFSFNKTTGERTEKNGYMKAKTIKNGYYYEEFGGGVCQVSTTLYNAFLLANLEIIEVHPHSLPVSYVEPCFDAMVNMGSSDLVIKNNTSNPVIIATSNKNDECLINIYGVKNEFEIKRISKKVDMLEKIGSEEISDYLKFGLEKPIKKGDKMLISSGKPGYTAVGWLEYYKDGVLFKTKNIRSDKYNPTKEIVLVG